MPVSQKFVAEIMDLLCAGFINRKIAVDKYQDVHERFLRAWMRRSASGAHWRSVRKRKRRVLSGDAVAKNYSSYSIGHVRRKIFGRRVPPPGILRNQADHVRGCLRVGAGENALTALDCLRPFRHISNGHVRYSHYAGFFLNSSAIGKNAERTLLQTDKIEESKRLTKS